jgi:NAD(P)-dependent dehydrogenase (short-subunit alcohol dehydrogenase family)
MQQNGGGQIINISTTLAQQPIAGVTAALTSLTKGGLDSVTRGLAIEYAAEGIQVNAIAPGIVDTPMHKPENPESLKYLHPIPRLAFRPRRTAGVPLQVYCEDRRKFQMTRRGFWGRNN